MCLDLLEQMKSCCCSVFSTSCLCVSFLTSFLCSDCGFAVTVGLAARQLFLPQLSEQRPALRSSSTAVLAQSAQSDSFCTTAPSTLTVTHKPYSLFWASSAAVCAGWFYSRTLQQLLTLSSHASHPSSLHYSLWLCLHLLD